MRTVIEVMLVALLPISEIRGAIPFAIYCGFDPISAYIISLIGNLIPIPMLLLSLEYIIHVIEGTKLGGVYKLIIKKVENKKNYVEKYGYLGLLLFVAIPLPVTGAWTGSLIASLLKLNKAKSLIAIALGVSVAGIIVLITSYGAIAILSCYFKFGS